MSNKILPVLLTAVLVGSLAVPGTAMADTLSVTDEIASEEIVSDMPVAEDPAYESIADESVTDEVFCENADFEETVTDLPDTDTIDVTDAESSDIVSEDPVSEELVSANTRVSIKTAIVATKYAVYDYTEKDRRPNVTVVLNGKTLTKDTDYTVAYANNRNVGTATITVTGIGNYKDTANTTFRLEKQDVSKGVLKTASKTYAYTGTARRPHPYLTLNGKNLKNGTDFTVTYANNKDEGKATITASGIGKYKGKISCTFKLEKAKLDEIKTFHPEYAYTGFERHPSVTVCSGGKKLTRDKDYTLTYKNCKEIGYASVTATGKGLYKGSVTAKFLIVSEVNIPVYRIRNTATNTYLYTASTKERENYAKKSGWENEGLVWYSPQKSTIPVYRLTSADGKSFHFTKSASEKKWLVSIGWKDDGIGFYARESGGIPVYRLYNTKTGSHYLTTNDYERDSLKKQGWNNEGIAWYVILAG